MDLSSSWSDIATCRDASQVLLQTWSEVLRRPAKPFDQRCLRRPLENLTDLLVGQHDIADLDRRTVTRPLRLLHAAGANMLDGRVGDVTNTEMLIPDGEKGFAKPVVCLRCHHQRLDRFVDEEHVA